MYVFLYILLVKFYLYLSHHLLSLFSSSCLQFYSVPVLNNKAYKCYILAVKSQLHDVHIFNPRSQRSSRKYPTVGSVLGLHLFIK